MSNYYSMFDQVSRECENLDTHELQSRQGSWYCTQCRGKGRELNHYTCQEIASRNSRQFHASMPHSVSPLPQQ